MSTKRTVPVEVAEVLARAEMERNALRITEQLDRKLYVAVNKVLEAAGGKWSRKDKAHIFEGDAAEAMDSIILTGEYRLPADFGQFDTPPDLAHDIVRRAAIEPGMSVLEPSAGIGNLVEEIVRITSNVSCFEIDEKRAHTLISRFGADGVLVIGGDFPSMPTKPLFDRVVMNPPFAKQADIAHVIHATKFLRPGGRLVSVMAAGVKFRTDRKTAAFRDMVYGFGGYIEDLPPDSFKESGTGVNTVVVVFNAPETP